MSSTTIWAGRRAAQERGGSIADGLGVGLARVGGAGAQAGRRIDGDGLAVALVGALVGSALGESVALGAEEGGGVGVQAETLEGDDIGQPLVTDRKLD